MSDLGVNSVNSYASLLHKILQKARDVKPGALIEPALKLEDLKLQIEDVATFSQNFGSKSYAAIETAVRNIFYTFLVR